MWDRTTIIIGRRMTARAHEHFEWVDEVPESAWRVSPNEPLVHKLKEHPGRWALVDKRHSERSAADFVQQLKRRNGLEAKQRRRGDTWFVYACWPETS